MQPTENYTIPRRTLDVEDYIDILRRHKGWIFGPFLLILVASVVGVYLWPDQYRSEALIQVKPQKVAQALVQSVVSQDLTEEINTMTNQILSRSVLTSIIRNFDLYKRELARRPIDDVIEIMKRNIRITPVAQGLTGGGAKTVAAFSVAFTYENKYDAQRVVQDLQGKFISQHIIERGDITRQTQQLLQDEVDAARKELDEKGNHLTAFRAANAGRLPDQLNANTQQLMALQQNMSGLQNAISRATAEKDTAAIQVKLYTDHVETLRAEKPPEAPVVVSARVQETTREIENMERALQIARQKYTETNPDVRDLKTRLEQLQKNKETAIAEDAEEQSKKAAAAKAPGLSASARREIEEYTARIELLNTTIAQKQKDIDDFTKQFKDGAKSSDTFSRNLSAIPVGEQEYVMLMREETLARQKYQLRTEALNKAQIASGMESSGQGESLSLLDPATLPNGVEEPNRPLVISIGAGAGLLLGVVIAGAREMKDASLKNLKDVRVYTQMAILGSVPLLENDFVVRRRKRLAWLGWTVACLLAGLIMAGAVVYYYLTLPTAG